MGYSSTYLVQANKPEILEQLKGVFDFLYTLNAKWSCLPEGPYLYCSDLKWYEFKEDLTKFTAGDSETLITVTRFGEDPEDIERVYFQNGRYQECKAQIIFDPCRL